MNNPNQTTAMSETPTPRTDKAIIGKADGGGAVVFANFARTLERELAALREELAKAKDDDTELRLTAFNANVERDKALARESALREAIQEIHDSANDGTIRDSVNLHSIVQMTNAALASPGTAQPDASKAVESPKPSGKKYATVADMVAEMESEAQDAYAALTLRTAAIDARVALVRVRRAMNAERRLYPNDPPAFIGTCVAMEQIAGIALAKLNAALK
jgi:hypothetical protein